MHFAAGQPAGLLYRLLTRIPIALLLALIFMNMKEGEILLPVHRELVLWHWPFVCSRLYPFYIKQKSRREYVMLDFWYSARCTRQVKLIVCIMTCAMIYLCSTVQALSAVLTGFSLGLGISIHLLRQLNLKIRQDNIYKMAFLFCSIAYLWLFFLFCFMYCLMNIK